MKTSQNPFSIYDLLGYLIPGLLSILGSNALFGNKFNIGHYTDGFWNMLNIDAFNMNKIIPLLILAYLVGHSLSYLSAMIIEKFSIWTINYPTVYLFAYIKGENVLPSKISDRFDFLFRFFTISNSPNKFIYFLRFLMLFFLIPLVIPLSLASFFLNAHITIRKPIDKKLAKFTFNKIKIFYKRNGLKLRQKDIGKFEWFRPLSHFVYENFPQHLPKIQNYVALYGFNRNITLMFVLFFWFIVLMICVSGFTLIKGVVLASCMFFCFIFYAAFNKFYRRYSLEILMALVSNPKKAKLKTVIIE